MENTSYAPLLWGTRAWMGWMQKGTCDYCCTALLAADGVGTSQLDRWVGSLQHGKAVCPCQQHADGFLHCQMSNVSPGCHRLEATTIAMRLCSWSDF